MTKHITKVIHQVEIVQWVLSKFYLILSKKLYQKLVHVHNATKSGESGKSGGTEILSIPFHYDLYPKLKRVCEKMCNPKRAK